LFFEQVAITLLGLGREKFKGDDRLFGRSFRRVDVANELHLDGGIIAEKFVAGNKKPLPVLPKGA
jgi:hypothetical protein